jgi:hypothetical protein
MNGATQFDGELFGGAPLQRLLIRCHLLRSGGSVSARRAELMAAIAWLPLVLLTIAEGSFLTSRDANSFALDIAAHARFLIALPLLSFAEAVMAPRLGGIVRQFAESGIVDARDCPRFEALVQSVRRRVSSLSAELVAIAIAYAIAAMLIVTVPLHELPGWNLNESAQRLSLAGWWHAWVSLPLLIVGFLGLIWRVCLWSRLLWGISRLQLNLVPVHPDGAAGLRFVSYSVRAFMLYALSMGVVVAGAVANRVLYQGVSPFEYDRLFYGLLLLVVLLFVGPLLVLSTSLSSAWHRGTFEYGSLAGHVGRTFAARWLASQKDSKPDPLTVQDFSALNDLYMVVGNVYAMRLSLLDLNTILMLAFATALPFVPVLVMSVPVDQIISRVAALLL